MDYNIVDIKSLNSQSYYNKIYTTTEKSKSNNLLENINMRILINCFHMLSRWHGILRALLMLCDLYLLIDGKMLQKTIS